MKSIILAGVSTLTLLSAGSALAQSNTGTITQSGPDQGATLVQEGALKSKATVEQTGASNLATISQTGGDNLAAVVQSTSGVGGEVVVSQDTLVGKTGDRDWANEVEVVQSGASIAQVRQLRFGNLADVNQSAVGSSVLASQTGFVAVNGAPNQLTIEQAADLSTMEVTQEGAGLTSETTQSITASRVEARVVQIGSDHTSAISQRGLGSFARVDQQDDGTGDNGGNAAILIQDNDLAFGSILQSGGSNTAFLSQSGQPQSSAIIAQHGTENIVSSQQTGRAMVELTQTGDFNLIDSYQDAGAGPKMPGMIEASQTGFGNTLEATQTESARGSEQSVTQRGRQNYALIDQRGQAAGSLAHVEQLGVGDFVDLRQSGASGSTTTIAMLGKAGSDIFADQTGGGGHSVTLTQARGSTANRITVEQGRAAGLEVPTSFGNAATVTQGVDTMANIATVNQLGSDNQAFVTQGTDWNTASITQTGTNGFATIRQ